MIGPGPIRVRRSDPGHKGRLLRRRGPARRRRRPPASVWARPPARALSELANSETGYLTLQQARTRLREGGAPDAGPGPATACLPPGAAAFAAGRNGNAITTTLYRCYCAGGPAPQWQRIAAAVAQPWMRPEITRPLPCRDWCACVCVCGNEMPTTSCRCTRSRGPARPRGRVRSRGRAELCCALGSFALHCFAEGSPSSIHRPPMGACMNLFAIFGKGKCAAGAASARGNGFCGRRWLQSIGAAESAYGTRARVGLHFVFLQCKLLLRTA